MNSKIIIILTTIGLTLISCAKEMGQWFYVLSISRYLERIADHTTNISEDVIYMVEGEIARHGYKS